MQTVIHRSSKNIYAQVIDDRLGTTLASVSSLEKSLGVVEKTILKRQNLERKLPQEQLKKGL